MTKAKLVDSNRRTHAAKVLVESSKKNQGAETHETENRGSKKGVDALTGQIRLIRQDVLKLRTDLAHGYDLVREWIETKISRRNLIKSK